MACMSEASMALPITKHTDYCNERSSFSSASSSFSSSPASSTPWRFSYPHTPPDSDHGSPLLKPRQVKLEVPPLSHSKRSPLPPAHCISPSPLPRLEPVQQGPASDCIRLPSLQEFDQGVRALSESHRNTPLPPSTPASLPSLLEITDYCRPQQLPPPPVSTSSYDTPHQMQDFGHNMYRSYAMSDIYDTSIDGYPSPPLDGENRHINQKYTEEQGDFIIYAWHDKKMKWQRIKQDFADMFGTKPKRTVQGLQAWYYRMNQRIPLWDRDGWLLFDNDDAVEPKHISIKCRESNESLGLAERYPERAMRYSWVDPELKAKARNWAAKRNMQLHERERRRRKEHRRLKL